MRLNLSNIFILYSISHSLKGDGVLRYQGRLCVPNVEDLRKQILEEAHGSRYSIHPGATKMYHDLRVVYWWDGLRRDITEFVANCPHCKQVKIEHLKSASLNQIMDVPTWNLEEINMDFVVGFPRTWKQNDSILVIVDRFTKSAHFIPVKSTYKEEDYARIYL